MNDACRTDDLVRGVAFEVKRTDGAANFQGQRPCLNSGHGADQLRVV